MDHAIRVAYDAQRARSRKPFEAACYAAHTSMVFDSIGRVRVCCANSEYILGDIRHERLDAIWSGARIEHMRAALRGYNLSLGCGICAHKIAAGAMQDSTLRSSQLIAQKYDDLEVEPTAPFWPKHLEFHLSNRCNLQCVTCFGEFSSTVREKRDRLPPYPQAYDDQFFDDLRKYLPHVRAAQFLGGEPFLIPEMYRVWDMLIGERLAPACHVTTNGTVFTRRVEHVLQALPMSVSVSMDGATAKTFEAIRVNARFDRVVTHLRRFRELCRAGGQSIGINVTLSRLNWHEFADLLQFAESEDIDVSVSEVFFPVHLSLFSLPLDECARIADTLQSQYETLSPYLTRNRRVFELRLQQLRHHLADPSTAPTRQATARATHVSLVRRFLAAGAMPTAPAHDVERLRHSLADWSGTQDRVEIVVNLDDLIIDASSTNADVPGWRADLTGRPLVDWYELLLGSLGHTILHRDLHVETGLEDRVMQFESDTQTVEMRVLTRARYDEEGRVCGAHALMSVRQVIA